jgi:hypothetical protein
LLALPEHWHGSTGKYIFIFITELLLFIFNDHFIFIFLLLFGIEFTTSIHSFIWIGCSKIYRAFNDIWFSITALKEKPTNFIWCIIESLNIEHLVIYYYKSGNESSQFQKKEHEPANEAWAICTSMWSH